MSTASAVKPGTTLPELTLPPISRTTLALFAGGSGDHNPIHIDIDYARTAGMSDVFAHGMLSMAYLGRLLTEWVPQERIRSFSARFLSITPVGGQPVCSGVVTDVNDIEGTTIATVDIEVRLSDGTVTVRGEATVDVNDIPVPVGAS
ncbi:dehydratase [Mycolicibacterium setense]|uniref:MaoC/PaaZ C-terminal domain-containing protein n=1 Tax=Mycolicibacterium setense TaxID=431269 RepID=UPI0007E9B4D1|nr:MaoC/PaaZ C-terminal domain-containing protein [Mycolicibacterium setense]OBB17641.1 dehydratase [Mycolicibacterium setense]